MKIAIIGSGISGLYCAWQLSKQHQVTVFEKNAYFGGHTDTHQLNINNQPQTIDSGFIVFNEQNYPVFCDMIQKLGVSWQQSNMSFSVNNLMTGLVYNPSTLWALLAKPANIFKPRFRSMMKDLFRFYKDNIDINTLDIPVDLTLGQYLTHNNYSHAFKEEHIYPMCGALWSATGEQIEKIPFRFAVGFFQNHNMLQVDHRPQWLTIKGGSYSYIKAIQTQCPDIQWKTSEVLEVNRTHVSETDVVKVVHQHGSDEFDWVIMASHADQTLQMLHSPHAKEHEILSSFQYQPNHMIVHTDKSIMPRAQSQWASWHVHVQKDTQGEPNYGYTYWMNKLQNLSSKAQVFSSLNCPLPIKHEHIHVERHYTHPVFDSKALAAQSCWDDINGIDRISYCGAYWGWGFHEDGAKSAKRVVDHLKGLQR